MSRLSRILFLSCLLTMVVGCDSVRKKQPTPNEFNTNLLTSIDQKQADIRKDAAVILAESATSVSRSLAHLAEVERAVYPHAKLPPPPNAMRIGMAEKASIDWSGPIEPLIKKIAKATHYKFRVIGKRPAIPILVSVNAKNTPLANILRDISFQANKQATIMLYSKRLKNRLVELRYFQP